MAHLPHLRRSQEDVVRVEPGQQQPPPAVQEAAVEQVHGEEPPEGADEKVHRADVPALTDPFLRGERRVPVRPLDELLQAPVRVMEQRGLEPPHRPLDLHRLVHSALDEAPPRAPEQATLIIGIQPAVLDPGAPEDVLPRDRVAVGGTAPADHPLDFATQLRRHPLVGVEREHPLPHRLLQGKVLLHGEARPRPDPDPVRELPRHLHGLVRGLGVHDDDLVGPGDALQARAEPLLLVPGDDRRREPAHSRSSRAAAKIASGAIAPIVPFGLCSPRQRGPYGPLRSARVGP